MKIIKSLIWTSWLNIHFNLVFIFKIRITSEALPKFHALLQIFQEFMGKILEIIKIYQQKPVVKKYYKNNRYFSGTPVFEKYYNTTPGNTADTVLKVLQTLFHSCFYKSCLHATFHTQQFYMQICIRHTL